MHARLGIEAWPCFSLVCDFRLMFRNGPIPGARRPTKMPEGWVNRTLSTLIVKLAEENLLTGLKFNCVSDNDNKHDIIEAVAAFAMKSRPNFLLRHAANSVVEVWRPLLAGLTC